MMELGEDVFRVSRFRVLLTYPLFSESVFPDRFEMSDVPADEREKWAWKGFQDGEDFRVSFMEN